MVINETSFSSVLCIVFSQMTLCIIESIKLLLDIFNLQLFRNLKNVLLYIFKLFHFFTYDLGTTRNMYLLLNIHLDKRLLLTCRAPLIDFVILIIKGMVEIVFGVSLTIHLQQTWLSHTWYLQKI